MAYLERYGMTDMQLKAKVLVMFENGITQANIANIFEVSQSTVSSWIKEARYLNEIGIIRNDVELFRRTI